MHLVSFLSKAVIALGTPDKIIADLFRAKMLVVRRGAEVLLGVFYSDAIFPVCMAKVEKAVHGLLHSYIRADHWATRRAWSTFRPPRTG